MNESEVWNPLLQFLKDEGYELPENVTLIVDGHTVAVEVPPELAGSA